MSEFFIPTREQIESISVGDELPNCFGKLAKVVSISAKQDDIRGKMFACVTLEFGLNSTISDSYKEGELHISTDLSNKYTSHELRQIEAKLLGEMNVR